MIRVKEHFPWDCGTDPFRLGAEVLDTIFNDLMTLILWLERVNPEGGRKLQAAL
jgi:hypothetical protein